MRRLIIATLTMLVLAGPAVAQTETRALQEKIDTLTAEVSALKNQMGDLQAALTATDAKAQQAIDGTTVLGNTQLTLQQRIDALESAPAGEFILPFAAIIDFGPRIPNKRIACQTTMNVAVACPILALTGAKDPNGDAMSARADCPNGTHDGMTYTPDADFTGSDLCTWSITDGSQLEPEGELTVTVAAP